MADGLCKSTRPKRMYWLMN